MANNYLYVRAVPPTDLNRNTEWFTYPGVWTTYILILFFAWLVVLSVFGCSPGMAWTTVNLLHAIVIFLPTLPSSLIFSTFYYLGSPCLYSALSILYVVVVVSILHILYYMFYAY